MDAPANIPQDIAASKRRRLRAGYFVIGGLNSLGASYYFNYLFFYMAEHFGYGNRDNLLVSGTYGLFYMLAAMCAGPFAQKRGYFFTLRAGFWGMIFFMALGGIAPKFLGYSHVMLCLEWVIVVGWTVMACSTWPTMQGLLSERQSPGSASTTAGIYNVVWAGAAAVSYLTSGVLLDKFGGEILFWVPVGLHLIQLLLLSLVQRLHPAAMAFEPPKNDATPEMTPRPIAKTRTFLYLGWIANPFAYVAIYAVIPLIPKLAKHFDLTPTSAGLICSIWFWTRLMAFFCFWVWPGWHYRFRWLLLAFIGMILGFIGMLMSVHLWMLVVAQLIFGLSIGLIYYSSLFYSMDIGVSKGKRGGFHEAAIGLGVFIGPTVGVLALYLFPQYANADIWGISTLLVLGLIPFLLIQYRSRSQTVG